MFFRYLHSHHRSIPDPTPLSLLQLVGLLQLLFVAVMLLLLGTGGVGEDAHKAVPVGLLDDRDSFAERIALRLVSLNRRCNTASFCLTFLCGAIKVVSNGHGGRPLRRFHEFLSEYYLVLLAGGIDSALILSKVLCCCLLPRCNPCL